MKVKNISNETIDVVIAAQVHKVGSGEEIEIHPSDFEVNEVRLKGILVEVKPEIEKAKKVKRTVKKVKKVRRRKVK